MNSRYYNDEELKKNYVANGNREYRQCAISVMDTIADPNITFDEKGICHYYYNYLEAEKSFVYKGKEGERKLQEVVNKVKSDGKGKKYDCILGISGGVDSTYLALQAKKLGLRPLLIHFDNGWDSELAVKNVENIIRKLGFDLYTFVVDWDEFRDIQLSYLKASVVDIEALTDHAIIGTIYRLASKYGVKYVLSGNNIVCEHVLPSYWIFNKGDDKNIRDIHENFGSVPLKTYPFFTFKERRYYANMKGIGTVPLLNFMDYRSKEVKETIIRELEWKDYGGKHYESIWTRFYQGYILPRKFNIDKRKAHFSNLIFSGQMTKEEALSKLAEPIYDPEQLKIDKEFVLKKLKLSEEEFEKLMNLPRREHTEFNYIKPLLQEYPFLKIAKPVWQLIKSKKG